MSEQQTPSQSMKPSGINHLVLNVRDMEESHRFWTEIIGFQQVGELKPRPEFPGVKMRFYSGDHDGSMNHHDLALVENKDLPKPPEQWGLFGGPCAMVAPTTSGSTTPTPSRAAGSLESTASRPPATLASPGSGTIWSMTSSS